jgi:hypothetical protein
MLVARRNFRGQHQAQISHHVAVIAVRRSPSLVRIVAHHGPFQVTLERLHRGVDIELDAKGHTLSILIDAKFHKDKTDVKTIEEVLGLADAVGANKAVIVCANGWTEPAENRASFSGIDLKLVPSRGRRISGSRSLETMPAAPGVAAITPLPKQRELAKVQLRALFFQHVACAPADDDQRFRLDKVSTCTVLPWLPPRSCFHDR